MNEKLKHSLYVKIISGAQPIRKIVELEKASLGQFSGDFNRQWFWDQNKLEQLNLKALKEIFKESCLS